MSGLVGAYCWNERTQGHSNRGLAALKSRLGSSSLHADRRPEPARVWALANVLGVRACRTRAVRCTAAFTIHPAHPADPADPLLKTGDGV